MDASLKVIDQLCQMMLQQPDNQSELDKLKELTALRQSLQPLSVSEILLLLQSCSEREKLINYQIQNGLLEALFEFCLQTPILEQESQFNTILIPFWSILEQLLRFRDIIKSLPSPIVLKALIFSSTAIEWWLPFNNQIPEQDKFTIINKLLKIISRLAINEQFALQFTTKSQAYRLQELMKRYFEEPDIVRLCLLALIEIATQKQLRSHLINQDYLRMINQIYKTYAEDITILTYTAELTYQLVLDESSILKRSDVIIILSCQILELKTYKLNDSLVERNLNSIAAIIHHNPSNQAIFMKSNSLDTLLTFVKDYVESPRISAALCLLINSLTYKNLEIKLILGQKGFLQVLISFLNYFTSYENYSFLTVKQALKAIGNIAIEESSGQATIIMEFIRISHQLITKPYIVENSQELQFICDLILDIVYTIYNPLNCPSYLIEETFNQGLIDFILQCIILNKKNKNIVQKAVDTLGPFLCFESGIQCFSDCDGFGIICKLIQLVHFDLELVLSCFEILMQVLSNDQDKLDLVMSYKINLDIVDTMKQIILQKVYTQATQQLFEIVLSLAYMLSCDSVKCRIMWNSQFIETSFELLQESKFINQTNLVIIFVRILLVYSQMQEASLIIVEYGGNTIIQIIRDNLLTLDIIDSTTRLIINLLEIQKNVDIFIEKLLLETGLTIIYAHMKSEQIISKTLLWYERISGFGENYKEKVMKECLEPLKIISDLSDLNIEHPSQIKLIKEAIQLMSKTMRTQRMSFLQLVTKDAKDYLLKGVTCKLVKENGASSELVVFLSPDLLVIQCKHSKHKITKQKWRMRVDMIESIFSNYEVEKTLWTNCAFSRASGIFKKKPDPARCLSIKGKGVLKHQGDVVTMCFNICAPTILDKNKMVEYLKVVIMQFTAQNQ